MNQGRIWCVVSPNVGLPLLIGSVAVTSLLVHAEILSHTNWMSNYWQGSAKKVASNTGPAVAGGSQVIGQAGGDAPSFTVSVVPSNGADGKATTAFLVTVTPGAATQTAAAATKPPTPDRLALSAHAPPTRN